MESTRTFALVLGLGFIAAGILGFVPAVTSPPGAGAPPLTIDSGYRYLFGLFPVNVLHNLVHLAFGIWGLTASRAYPWARSFAASTAVIYAVLTLMGLVPGLQTTFGLTPLFGHDVWLHGLVAVVSAYFGFRRTALTATDEVITRRAA